MKKVFVLPYSEVLKDSDFVTGYLKGISVIYKKNYYPFNQIGNVFTFQHGFFSLDENMLKEKRKGLQMDNNIATQTTKISKENSLILQIEQAINILSSRSYNAPEVVEVLLRCKDYIAGR